MEPKYQTIHLLWVLSPGSTRLYTLLFCGRSTCPSWVLPVKTGNGTEARGKGHVGGRGLAADRPGKCSRDFFVGPNEISKGARPKMECFLFQPEGWILEGCKLEPDHPIPKRHSLAILTDLGGRGVFHNLHVAHWGGVNSISLLYHYHIPMISVLYPYYILIISPLYPHHIPIISQLYPHYIPPYYIAIISLVSSIISHSIKFTILFMHPLLDPELSRD